MKSKQEAFLVNSLRQAFKNFWYQKDMTIFNRTDLEIQKRQPARKYTWKNTNHASSRCQTNVNIGITSDYIDDNYTWGFTRLNANAFKECCGLLHVLTLLKSEENFLLSNLSEVELVAIERLKDLTNSRKLSGPLLQMPIFIQLGYEAIITWNHLHISRSKIFRKIAPALRKVMEPIS